MKKMFQAAVVAAAVLAVPAMSLAAQTKPAATAQATPAAKAAPAVRSARGIVKSMDASTLVLIEKASRKKKSHDVRFLLDPSTQKDGNVVVGSTVRVTYHNDAKRHVATEVRVAGRKS